MRITMTKGIAIAQSLTMMLMGTAAYADTAYLPVLPKGVPQPVLVDWEAKPGVGDPKSLLDGIIIPQRNEGLSGMDDCSVLGNLDFSGMPTDLSQVQVSREEMLSDEHVDYEKTYTHTEESDFFGMNKRTIDQTVTKVGVNRTDPKPTFSYWNLQFLNNVGIIGQNSFDVQDSFSGNKGIADNTLKAAGGVLVDATVNATANLTANATANLTNNAATTSKWNMEEEAKNKQAVEAEKKLAAEAKQKQEAEAKQKQEAEAKAAEEKDKKKQKDEQKIKEEKDREDKEVKLRLGNLSKAKGTPSAGGDDHLPDNVVDRRPLNVDDMGSKEEEAKKAEHEQMLRDEGRKEYVSGEMTLERQAAKEEEAKRAKEAQMVNEEGRKDYVGGEQLLNQQEAKADAEKRAKEERKVREEGHKEYAPPSVEGNKASDDQMKKRIQACKDKMKVAGYQPATFTGTNTYWHYQLQQPRSWVNPYTNKDWGADMVADLMKVLEQPAEKGLPVIAVQPEDGSGKRAMPDAPKPLFAMNVFNLWEGGLMSGDFPTVEELLQKTGEPKKSVFK
jgi:hypothetical protein